MTHTEININRLNHLLKLYGLSKDDLLHSLNKDRKKGLSENEVFGHSIKISVLKKIDELFKKGLSYYIDPKDLKEAKEESIFFRKDKFNAELSFGAKQIVTHFEEEKIAFSALSKLADFKTERTLPSYKVTNSPKKVAEEIRKVLYPKFTTDGRGKIFLKSLIGKFAENNIVVFEFIENWNKIEKANINGFYLSPNVIVLKRQKSYRRETFTLIHELGHYLLNIEEIDEKIGDDFTHYESLGKIEKWCNDFAYYFLVGTLDETISKLEKASAKNDYHHELIKQISEQTNLSEYALFTRLRINDTISFNDYQTVKEDILNQIKEREAEEKKKREKEKEEGRQSNARASKPILSPLYVNTVQSAFIEGIIGETEFCRRLNIKPEKIENYLK
ncbi:MAG: ImmA/IrrE family metallo-endopeptidase [Bacteroidetes bacterium]|nr:ImmA/IrrE family metallo-endopeptidase [Bacteroidota bacterium]